MKKRANGEGLIRGVCFVEGCKLLQKYKGNDKLDRKMYSRLCNKHNCLKINIESKFNSGEKYQKLFTLKHIPNKKCVRCGWDKAPCDRHRLKRELGYKEGNVLILCPNCHRLESFPPK